MAELREFALPIVRADQVTHPAPALAGSGGQANLPALFIGTQAVLWTGYIRHQD